MSQLLFIDFFFLLRPESSALPEKRGNIFQVGGLESQSCRAPPLNSRSETHTHQKWFPAPIEDTVKIKGKGEHFNLGGPVPVN